jgi:hypothetical protein
MDLPYRFQRVQERKHPNLEQERQLVEMEDSMPEEMELETST